MANNDAVLTDILERLRTAEAEIRENRSRISAIEADRGELRAGIAAYLSRVQAVKDAQGLKVQALAEQVQSLLIAHEKERLSGLQERLDEIEEKIAWLPKRSDTGKLRRLDQNKARRVARLVDAHFNEEELRELCLDFELDFENVEGDTKKEKATELTMYFLRRKTLDMFVGWLEGQRSNVEWPE